MGFQLRRHAFFSCAFPPTLQWRSWLTVFDTLFITVVPLTWTITCSLEMLTWWLVMHLMKNTSQCFLMKFLQRFSMKLAVCIFTSRRCVDSSHFKIYLYLSASCSDLKNFVYMCLWMYVCLLYALCIRICECMNIEVADCFKI